MGEPVTINLRHVARGLGIPARQVQAVVELLDEGNTVPFITRYRKDQTGGLNEEQVRQIQARLTKSRLLAERKQTILRSIQLQGKLTESLEKQIRAAGTPKRLEDLYLPYKPKKQTLATTARERGLEPLALEVLRADALCADLDARAADFVNPDRQVPSAADALLGAGHILAEQISERADLRQRLREILQKSGKLVTSLIDRAGPAPSPERRAPEPAGPSDSGTRPAAEPPAPVNENETEPVSSHQGVAPPEARPVAEPGDSPDAESTEQAAEPPGPRLAEGTDPVPGENPVPQSAARRDESLAVSDASETVPPPQLNTVSPEEPGEGLREPSSEAGGPEPHSDAKDDSPAESPDRVDSADASQPALPNGEPSPQTPVDAGPHVDAGSDEQADPTVGSGDLEDRPEAADQQAVSAEAAGQSSSPPEQLASPPEVPKPPAHPAPAPPPRPPRAEKKLTKKQQKKKKADEKRQKAFRDYFDYAEDIKKIPPHRVLAINRGERAKVLRVKIECDVEAMHRSLDELCVPADHPHAEFLRGCARDALTRLILPALEREARRELTERSENHAVGVFAKNLRKLLLQPPIRGRRVLAVDPGFKSGCKLVALDQFGNVLDHGVIYLVGKGNRREQARRTVGEMIERFHLTLVAIGNGTGCREAEDFFAELITGELRDRGVAYVIVNEAGASVYSASRLGREEFPEYDAALRGAISIGRRLQDPLSELVKIDPANIGVGLYQHDVKAKHLRASLDEVVESCVNYVGVDVNTASPALLRYVSGLNQLTARRVHEHRREHGPFRSRQQLREVAGFGEGTFVQAAGFLKITSGEDPLDATWIHPESYEVAARVLERLDGAPADLTRRETAAPLAERANNLDVEALASTLQVGTLLLKDILSQLARPGRDPREDLPAPIFKKDVLKLEDLAAGMELTGTVLNVVDFGAFVDIGMHDSGLVHVSQLADKFIRDPHDFIAVGDIVKVWVLEVDKQRRRVSLTMIPPGAPKVPSRREEKPQRRPPDDRPRKPRGDRPRPERRPRDKGPPRGKEKRRPPKEEFRPRRPPKPVTPITDGMKAGKEPMRSFSDLAQFFQVGEKESPPASRSEGGKGPRRQQQQSQPAPKEATSAEPPESPRPEKETAPPEQPAGQPPRQPREQSFQQPAELPSGQPAEQAAEPPAEQSAPKAAEPASGQAAEPSEPSSIESNPPNQDEPQSDPMEEDRPENATGEDNRE